MGIPPWHMQSSASHEGCVAFIYTIHNFFLQAIVINQHAPPRDDWEHTPSAHLGHTWAHPIVTAQMVWP